MESTSSFSPLAELDLGNLSSYEDALDQSDSELRNLCEDANRHLNRTRPRTQPVLLSPIHYRSPSKAKSKRSSSSEHSSIEKLGIEASTSGMRRRTGTRDSRRKTPRSGSDQSDSPEGWRHINFAFQEAAHYPVLIQINQQLQLLSRQLFEIESTNALQLKIIVQLLGRLLKTKKRRFFSLRFLRFLPVVILALSWPFLARIIYTWYLRRRQGLALAFLRYL